MMMVYPLLPYSDGHYYSTNVLLLYTWCAFSFNFARLHFCLVGFVASGCEYGRLPQNLHHKSSWYGYVCESLSYPTEKVARVL